MRAPMAFDERTRPPSTSRRTSPSPETDAFTAAVRDETFAVHEAFHAVLRWQRSYRARSREFARVLTAITRRAESRARRARIDRATESWHDLLACVWGWRELA